MGWEGGDGGSQNSLGDVFKSPRAEEKQAVVVLSGDQSTLTDLMLLATVSG